MKKVNKIKLVTMIIISFVAVSVLIKGPIFSKADNVIDNMKEVDKEDMELFAENYSKMRIGKDNYDWYKTNYPDVYEEFKNIAKDIYMECIENKELWSFDRKLSDIFEEPTPSEYFKIAIMMMDGALYTNTEEWKTIKDEYLVKSNDFKTYEEAYIAIKKVIVVAGGNHSAFEAPINNQQIIEDNEENNIDYEAFMKEMIQFSKDISINDLAVDELLEYLRNIDMPICKNNDGILHIILPSIYFDTGIEKQQEYANSVVRFLKDNQDAKGVVVDLRINSGGSIYPMIAAISPLLKDGELFYYLSENGKSAYCLNDGMVDGNKDIKVDNFKMRDNIPVTVLSGISTFSAAETTLLALKSIDNIKIFGKPTMGDGCSANEVIIFPDGCQMRISVAGYETLDGEKYMAEPIVPDVDTDMPLQDAIDWINGID